MTLFQLNPLDPNLVIAKPIEEAPTATIDELEANGALVIERKRNGHATLAAITRCSEQPVGMYSRGIRSLTANFPHHVESLRAMDIPSDTLLQGECTFSESGIERPGAITRFAGSGSARAIALQDELGVPTFSLFNVLVHKGISVVHLPYRDRLDIVRELCARRPQPFVDLVEVLDCSSAEAKAQSLREKWEGLVFYDAAAPTEFSLTGKTDQPPRPYGCWKWKDYLEGDFVATGWKPSSSKKFKGLVRDLLIAQRDPLTGELVHWGKVGTGLSAKERALYADDSLYPMVFEIKFESRTPNKRLLSARILRRRSDKAPHECFSST